MVMDVGPYPFGRSAVYVVPGSESRSRVFKSKDEAMAALTEGHVLEFAETNAGQEYFLAYLHDRDGESRVMDVSTTNEGTAAKYFPDVTALVYDRYGSLQSFSRDLGEFKAFWARVQDSELWVASRGEGRAEAAFIDALMDAGRKLAYKSGGYVCLDELEGLIGSDTD